MNSAQKTVGISAILVLFAAAIWFAASIAEPPAASAAPAPAAAAAQPLVSAAEPERADAAAQRVEATPVPAVSPAVAATAMLRGRVLDSRGQPLPSVPVHLCASAAGDPRIGERLPAAEVTSDALGMFALPLTAGQAAVPMAGGGFCTLRTTPNLPLRSGAEILLVAAPAVDLAGTVRDDDGMPLPGVRAQVNTLFLEEFPLPLEQTVDPAPQSVTTGADGRFALPRTPIAAGVNLLFTKPGFDTKRVPSLQAGSGYLEVTLRSSAGAPGRTTGTALDAAGRAVEGAELRLGFDQQTKSSATGAFEFEFPKRPSRLVAARRGFLPIVREGIGKATPMPLLLTFTSAALVITGRVATPDGAPLPGMLVNLVDPTMADHDASLERLSAPPIDLPHGALSRCDAEGRFAIGGLAERSYRLRAHDPKTLESVQSEPIAAGSTGVVLIVPADVLLEDLAGIVVGRDGTPLARVAVGTSLLASQFDGVHSVPGPLAITDATGRFVLHAVPRQHVRLVLSGEDLVGTLVPIEDVLADPGHRLVVLRRCFVQIEGPLDVEVRFEDADGKELRVESHSQGRAFSTNGWTMRAEKSPVLTLPESAATMRWSKGGKEVGRKAIAVEPGRDRMTTLVAR